MVYRSGSGVSGLWLVMFCMALQAPLPADDEPRTMTRIVAKRAGKEVEGTFAAKPRLLLRAGTAYCRMEEQPDPDAGIHGLLIIHEPDVWMVNRFTQSAKHMVDPGPTFNCRLPVFTMESASAAELKSVVAELEFGRELAFFKSRGAEAKPGPVLREKQTQVYTMELGDTHLFLFTVGKPERPWAIARRRGGSNELYWYGDYEEVPFEPELFRKPEGVKIVEVK